MDLEQLRLIHAPKMHPEYARRLFACIGAADGLVGIGGGWRSSAVQAASYARDQNTFAPPGSSFHETQAFASGIDGYAAVDTVGRDGRHEAAWQWLRDNAGRFGLRTFWNVNGEPWHVQCNDIPAGVRSWKAAGSPDPPSRDLGNVASTTPVYGSFPFHDDKPPVSVGWHGDLVRYIQTVIFHEAGGEIVIDGDFGPRTASRVRDVQAISTLQATGIVDWDGTWQVLDKLAGHDRQTETTVADTGIATVGDGYYWVQRGDSPRRVADRVYGDGNKSTMLDPTDPRVPGFARADHQIRLPGVTGLATAVRPGEGPWAIVSRLQPNTNPASLLQRFYELNGGEHRTLLPGELVFLDTPG